MKPKVEKEASLRQVQYAEESTKQLEQQPGAETLTKVLWRTVEVERGQGLL